MSVALTTNHEQLHFNPEIRRYNDTVTWLAEVLDGRMQSRFEYRLSGDDLIADDGGSMRQVFDNSLSAIRSEVAERPELGFELRRQTIEREEFDEMLAMAKGDGHNTMLVVSDYPEEADRLPDDDRRGYDSTRRVAMLRLITRSENGSLTIQSHSLDKSDRYGLEKIYDYFGKSVSPGEMLGQRLRMDVDEPFRSRLLEVAVRVYDTNLAARYGGEWYAGRRDDRATMDFVQEQSDLIQAYLSGSRSSATQYDLAAAMRRRFVAGSHEKLDAQFNVVKAGNAAVLAEMHWAGQQARQGGESFNGCGMSLTADAINEQIEALGYGATSSNTGGTMRCVNCPACRTFHDKVRTKNGRPVCDNPSCKLSDKVASGYDAGKKDEDQDDLAATVRSIFSISKK